MIDIDRFKSINDHYGHQCGDQALVWLSEQFGKTIRANDYIYRIGGEEFLILLRNANPQTAYHRAENIRATVEASDFYYHDQSIDLSISIGVATYPYHGAEIDSVIRAADTALYDAKAAGRNRVRVCSGTLM
jgi:diguanylate cyclase (GGDEF)-like protein